MLRFPEVKKFVTFQESLRIARGSFASQFLSRFVNIVGCCQDRSNCWHSYRLNPHHTIITFTTEDLKWISIAILHPFSKAFLTFDWGIPSIIMQVISPGKYSVFLFVWCFLSRRTIKAQKFAAANCTDKFRSCSFQEVCQTLRQPLRIYYLQNTVENDYIVVRQNYSKSFQLKQGQNWVESIAGRPIM